MNHCTVPTTLPPTAGTPEAPGYEQDFAVWSEHQAALLRAKDFVHLDLDNLIEELDAMAGNQRRELQSRLEILLAHLLKCQYQPEHKSGSWLGTLHVQRSEIGILLEQSPSLDRFVVPFMEKMYKRARKLAAAESGLTVATFPSENPYSRQQLLDDDFIP